MHGTPAAVPASKPTADMTNGFQHASPQSWDKASETVASKPLAIKPTWHWEDTCGKMVGLAKQAGALKKRILNFGSGIGNQIPKELGLDLSFLIWKCVWFSNIDVLRITRINRFPQPQTSGIRMSTGDAQTAL